MEASLDIGADQPLRLELVFSPLETEEAEQGFLIVGRDLTAVRRLEEKLRRQALYDGLTGLYNRHQFHAILEREAIRAGRTGRGLGMIFFDLDGFKAINDTLGHQAGDKVLKSMAKMLWDNLRKGTDFPCRFGGDEFAAILTEVDEQGAQAPGRTHPGRLAGTIQETRREPVHGRGHARSRRGPPKSLSSVATGPPTRPRPTAATPWSWPSGADRRNRD